MTDEQQHYDRKKLVILRTVLIIVGGAIGGLALWQYFVYYPDVVRREYSIVITVVSSVLVATVFGLSAKAFYRLGATVAGYALSANAKLGIRGMTAVLCGFVAAGAAVMLFDVAIRTVWDIWAVRLLVDIIVYILCSALGIYGFLRWIDAEENEDVALPSPKTNGYLLGWECFCDERVLVAADALINVKVCDGAYKALCVWDGDKEAIKRLDELIMSGKADVLRCNKAFADKAQYDEYEKALSVGKRLKRVGGADDCDCDVSLSMFAATVKTDDGRDMPADTRHNN